MSVRQTYHRWCAAEDAHVRAGYAAGKLAQQIADELGITISAVRGRASTLKIKHRFMHRSLAETFDDYVIPEPNGGCWLWMGSVSTAGYGQLRIGGRKGGIRVATHVALELAGRPLPKGMFACHRCDNPFCVNPDHLFHGTPKDNIQDCIRKGRFIPPPKPLIGLKKPHKEYCYRGHMRSGANLYISPKGLLGCRACSLENKRQMRMRRIAAGLTSDGKPRVLPL